MQRDEAGVAPHHLQDHHAIVALGGGVQLVDGLHRRGDRGVEAEGRDRAADVVVDRLGTPTMRMPFSNRLLGDGQRPVATDGDERLDAQVARVVEQLVGAVDLEVAPVVLEHRIGERIAAVGRAQDGAAQVGDAAHAVARHRHHLVLAQQSHVAALDAQHVPAAVEGREYRGTNDGVEARASPPPVEMAMRMTGKLSVE